LLERQDYDFDPDLVLQKEEEERELAENMIDSLILRVTRQLNAVGPSNESSPADSDDSSDAADTTESAESSD
jgi:hypothetical protein